jgi:hypothetical protein
LHVFVQVASALVKPTIMARKPPIIDNRAIGVLEEGPIGNDRDTGSSVR